jgi:hypothetical protein
MGGRDGYLSALAPELRHEFVTGVQQFARRRDNHHTRPLSVSVALSTAVSSGRMLSPPLVLPGLPPCVDVNPAPNV